MNVETVPQTVSIRHTFTHKKATKITWSYRGRPPPPPPLVSPLYVCLYHLGFTSWWCHPELSAREVSGCETDCWRGKFSHFLRVNLRRRHIATQHITPQSRRCRLQICQLLYLSWISLSLSYYVTFSLCR